MTKRLIITEKPSVAADIAAALGGFHEAGEGVLESEDFVVSWAFGHLLELAEPQDYDKNLRSWSIKHLPIIPEEFKVKPREGQKGRLDLIRKLGRRKDVDGIVNACDAGREGELIFRWILEHTALDTLPQQRLWLQSMTPQAIRDAFDHLRPGADLDRLANAARIRAIGDWLIGMNSTRALTQRLKSRGEQGSWSAGRVQTPTLNILVEREHEILAHVPRTYWELVGVFAHGEGSARQEWEARWFDPKVESGDDRDVRASRIFERERVDALVGAIAARKEGAASESRKKSKQSPPLLFDLTTLQREANKRYSMSAKGTLRAAQRLYETHKVLTYPRTDSRYLPEDYGPIVHQLVDMLAGTPDSGPTQGLATVARKIAAAGPQNLDKLLDSSKVSDHFAIVPTGNPVEADLSGDDARIFGLVVRQFLAALMGPATWATVERVVGIDVGEPRPAQFKATARSLEVPGFLEALGQEAGAGTELPPLVPGQDAVEGVRVEKREVREEQKDTKPPARYSEGQLLRMMETAGQDIEDEGASDAIAGRGLGTPATRADTIERLVNTGYCRRTEGKLAPTSKAMRLMDVLRRVDVFGLASPQLTGEWFHQLNEVEAGRRDPKAVTADLGKFTRDVVGSLVNFEHEHLYDSEPPLGPCPQCGGDVVESAWGYPCKNNTGVDAPCNFIIWKDRAGRFMDRSLVSRLLRDRRVGPLTGFVDRAGRRYSTGTLSLVKDPEKGKWILDVEYGADEDGEAISEEVGEALCACPAHEGCSIIETNLRYVCEKVLKGETRNGPVLPRSVCQREMSAEEAERYFGGEAKTAILEGFVSKRGHPFRGALFRKETGKRGFEFPPREGKKGAEEGAEAGDAAAPKRGAKKATPARGAKKAAPATGAKKPAVKKGTSKAAAAPAEGEGAAKEAPATRRAPAKKAPAKKAAATPEDAPATAAPPAKKAASAKKAPAAKKGATKGKGAAAKKGRPSGADTVEVG